MLEEFLKAFMAIFVIMDALGNIPIFNGLNKSFSEQQKKKNITLAVIIAGIVLVVFLFLGNQLLNFFGIRISSFKIAGGIVLLILGIEVTLGIKFKKDKTETKDLAVVP